MLLTIIIHGPELDRDPCASSIDATACNIVSLAKERCARVEDGIQGRCGNRGDEVLD